MFAHDLPDSHPFLGPRPGLARLCPASPDAGSNVGGRPSIKFKSCSLTNTREIRNLKETMDMINLHL